MQFVCSRPNSFQSTLSLRRATSTAYEKYKKVMNFNPRSPCGERRIFHADFLKHRVISIHALLAESDQGRRGYRIPTLHFNPRSPCGERPSLVPAQLSTSAFQSTLSLRRATVSSLLFVNVRFNFNPRSPCGERPHTIFQTGAQIPHFNPRSPCGERPDGRIGQYVLEEFQSTLSLRRATSEGRYPK